jgi:hypothetical protein
MKTNLIFGRLTLVVLGVVAGVLVGGTAAHAQKVTVTPNTATVAEGATQTYQVKLDAPIISSGGDPNLYLNLTASVLGRVTFSPTQVVYAPNEWPQTKTFDVTALEDTTHTGDTTITLTITASSTALYYNNYVSTAHITITDNDPEPTPAPGPTVPPAAPVVKKTIRVSKPIVQSSLVAAVATAPAPVAVPSPSLSPSPTVTPQGSVEQSAQSERSTGSLLAVAALVLILLFLLFWRHREKRTPSGR